MLPLYEAKMIHLYDTRWATYEPDGSTRLMTEQEKVDRKAPMPRYWVADKEVDRKLDGKWDKAWFLGWRDIARATDERTYITTQLPRVAFGHKVLLALPRKGNRAVLQAIWSSLAFDYVARQKLGGTSMSYFTVYQLPTAVPTAEVEGLSFDRSAHSWIAAVVDVLNSGAMMRDIRRKARAELDAYLFHLYGISRSDVEHVMGTFTITKSKDLDQHGEFLTQRLVLESYDAMAHAIQTSTPYVSPLSPGVHR